MSNNKHFGMESVNIWMKPNEFNKLKSYLECNEKEKVFDLLSKINQRGDL